jgi:hypothetical protein
MNICGRLALRVFGFSFPPTVGDAEAERFTPSI